MREHALLARVGVVLLGEVVIPPQGAVHVALSSPCASCAGGRPPGAARRPPSRSRTSEDVHLLDLAQVEPQIAAIGRAVLPVQGLAMDLTLADPADHDPLALAAVRLVAGIEDLDHPAAL